MEKRSATAVPSGFQRDPFGVAPQVFEIVKRPLFAVEEVADDVPVIEDHPLAGRIPVLGERALAMLLADRFADRGGDRFQLRLGGTRTDRSR